ncbi:MAG TPA: type IV toxin-antitoxin system AbiEi family antitoxin domain-containing protein, partial [Acidimicrobiales bacterium]|nr:type IV toxin-antitoxin system AbiEi family antitoxin domain-containing protein [Acidimicrobiales bacterium]
MPSSATVRKVADLAAHQAGLLTRQQALDAGIAPATLARMIGDLLQPVAHGVYHVITAPTPDLLDLRAAYLQLAPDVRVWQRKVENGVVSHRSAAAVYRLGDLPADIQQFTLPERRRVRRSDVRIYVARLEETHWVALSGFLVTRPSRIVADLLRDEEEPEAVARVAVDALRSYSNRTTTFVDELAPLARRLGFREGAGESVLRWLLEMGGDQ